MPRYTKNRFKADCVPVAYVNAMKFTGMNISYRDTWFYFVDEMQCITDLGTHDEDWEKFLKKQSYFKYFKVNKLTPFQIKNNLDKNRCIVVFSLGHAFLISGKTTTGKYLITHNIEKSFEKISTTAAWLELAETYYVLEKA